MRLLPQIFAVSLAMFFCAQPLSLCAADSSNASALAALKLLPKDKAAKLVSIVARDGTPVPDRWYLIAYDPTEENGLREYAVAGKEIVGSRPFSQFVETAKPDDVIGASAVKIDSDHVAKLARQYAQVNNVAISKIDYELTRESSAAAPIWRVTCFDESNNRVGEIDITAGKGNVISHDGFAVVPPPGIGEKSTAQQHKKSSPKFDVYAESQVAPDDAQQPSQQQRAAPGRATQPDQVDQSDNPDDARTHRRDDSAPDDDRGVVGNAARSVGRTIRRILPF